MFGPDGREDTDACYRGHKNREKRRREIDREGERGKREGKREHRALLGNINLFSTAYYDFPEP